MTGRQLLSQGQEPARPGTGPEQHEGRMTMQTTTQTGRRRTAGAATLALAASAGLAALGTSGASADDPGASAVRPGPQIFTLAGRADFPDDIEVKIKRSLDGGLTEVLNLKDPGDVIVAQVVLEPGAGFQWHTHPGPVVVSVASGELTYQQSTDCVERFYGTNQAFVDPGNIVHTAWNDGDVATVLYATFYDVPAGEGPTRNEPVQDGWCD